MTDQEKLLIMTLLDLLGKSSTPEEIDAAYERQKTLLGAKKEEFIEGYTGVKSVGGTI